MKRYFADGLTFLRILCAVALLFCPVFSVPFFVLYTAGGLTDAADGFIARRLKTESRIGQILDTVADACFLLAAGICVLPHAEITPSQWIWLACLMLLKIIIGILYFSCRIAPRHTTLLKVTGVLLFLYPYVLPFYNSFVCVAVLCFFATLSAVQELYLMMRLARLDFVNATEADTNELMMLYKSVQNIPYCTWNEYYPTLTEIKYDLSNGSLFILKKKTRIVGAVSVVADNELDTLPCFNHSDAKEIARLCIRPDCQHKGYSGLLLTRAEDAIKQQGAKAVHLLVAKKNVPAVNLYRKAGYRFFDEVEMYEDIYYPCEKELP